MEKETKAETTTETEPKAKTGKRRIRTKSIKTPAGFSEPNTIFTGKREQWNKELNKVGIVPREAPLIIIDGANQIKLPDAKTQAAGFHLDDASRSTVFNLFPNDFKRPREK